MHLIESDLKYLCNNSQSLNEANESQAKSKKRVSPDEETRKSKNDSLPENQNTTKTPPQWSLSLTPKGLRIDTNIVSLHDVYTVLLPELPHINRSHCCNDQPDPKESDEKSSKRKLFWKPQLKVHPVYSMWETYDPKSKKKCKIPVDKNTTRDHHGGSFETFECNTLPEETIYRMTAIFDECFLCLPCFNPLMSIGNRYRNGMLDPLLGNAVFAWTSRHTAIYHNLFPGKDPNEVGQGFYLRAKELAKERFMKTSVDTMFSLLIMYTYAVGIPNDLNEASAEDNESEAYIYLGLAIRMCLDLKMNVEPESPEPSIQEKSRRFFWALYFLETLNSAYSEKPFTLPSQISIKLPTFMQHEITGNPRYRVEYISERFKIARIYRKLVRIITDQEPLLFSQLSVIEKQLQIWYSELPHYFKYNLGDIHTREWGTFSFREQGCIKLNFEYHYQLCQLYGMFSNKGSGAADHTTTLELISREVCLRSVRYTAELLECWTQLKQPWCHFSLEYLMMTITIINTYLLRRPEDRKLANQYLQKIADIMAESPLRYHKYVVMLIHEIESIMSEVSNRDTTDSVIPLTIENSAETMAPNIQFEEMQFFPNPVHTPTLLNFTNPTLEHQTMHSGFYPHKQNLSPDQEKETTLYSSTIDGLWLEPTLDHESDFISTNQNALDNNNEEYVLDTRPEPEVDSSYIYQTFDQYL